MTTPYVLHLGDCRETLMLLEDNSVDSIVTDPPYELGFMGKSWDSTGIANNAGMWSECLRVLKPGGHLLAFSGSRTYHRMVCAVEDGGFEVRDQIMWIYGNGFPKSRNLDGEWRGWGSSLKPAHEPICLARKPIIGTIAGNVAAHGTGAMNIDACRVSYENDSSDPATNPLYRKHAGYANGNSSDGASSSFSIKAGSGVRNPNDLGRWPANVIHDGSREVIEAFPDAAGQQGRAKTDGSQSSNQVYGALRNITMNPAARVEIDKSAARFFYCTKASRADRNHGLEESGPIHKHGVTLRQMENAVRNGVAKGNTHPTVKPTDLMAYLCRLVTPPGGVVLDPFMGSGSTGKAAMREGFRFIGIDVTPEYVEIARARIAAEVDKRKPAETVLKQAGLFEAEAV